MSDGKLTLGSLFSGSGGFELGGLLAGIVPLWASEVEMFPIRVTTRRLPWVRHYGDVSKIHGADIEPVDIITFGSPCQDMSIAGKRDGLGGSRSCLFYEAIRIVKEMRCVTDGRYPRYIVWENVPGAFSSNKGEDFKAVLEAVCSVKGGEADIPPYGKWPNAGEIVADGYSVAWRVLDAQYWGVPQRRKRIFLVADFAGQCAGKILFESEGLSGYSAEGFRSWQRSAGGAAACAGMPGICLNDQGGSRMNLSAGVAGTLRAEMGGHAPCVMDTAVYENHSQDTRYTGPLDTAPTVSSTYGTGGNNQPFVVGDAPCYGAHLTSDKTGNDRGCVYETETARTIGMRGNSPDPNQGGVAVPDAPKAYGISSDQSHAMLSDNPHSGIYEAVTSRTLDTGGGNPGCNQGGIAVVEQRPVVGGAHDRYREDSISPTVDTNGAKPTCSQAGVSVVQSYTLQGSMIGRKDGNGPQGDGIGEDVSFTLNTVDRHAVYAMTTGFRMQAMEDQSPTLMARDFKDPAAVAYGIGRDALSQGRNAQFSPSMEKDLQPTMVAKGPGAVQSGYTVRRLTPTECARLQGFPDWWCSHLGMENPSRGEMEFWRDVFGTHRKVMGKSSKPKTDSQIRKWLKDPHSDSAEYAMWGNGVALPCVYFVLAGIVYYAQNPAQ